MLTEWAMTTRRLSIQAHRRRLNLLKRRSSRPSTPAALRSVYGSGQSSLSSRSQLQARSRVPSQRFSSLLP